MIDQLGGAGHLQPLPDRLGGGFSTPFRMFKRYSYLGGVCDPLVIHWPAGIRRAARCATSTTTAPTSSRRSSSAAAWRCPTWSTATSRPRCRGCRCATLRRRRRADPQERQYYEMWAPAASGRTAGRRSPSTARASASATSTKTPGSSSTPTRTARRRTTSPSSTPRSCRSSSTLWLEEAEKYDVLPLSDQQRRGASSPLEFKVAGPAERDLHVLPRHAEVPGASAPRTRTASRTRSSPRST